MTGVVGGWAGTRGTGGAERGWACHPGGADQVPRRGRMWGGRRLAAEGSGEFSGAGLFLVITILKGKKMLVLAKKILIV